MNFLKNIFGKAEVPDVDIDFGRSAERITTEKQYLQWDKAIEAFEAEQYLDSLEHFVNYFNYNNLNLIQHSRTETTFSFTCVQGSRIIEFFADQKTFRAVAGIAIITEDNIGLMRRLLESSYKLVYGRYCLQSNGLISIVFDGYIQEASPTKLFEGLKEIALRSDKEDDILLEDFESLKSLSPSHIVAIPDSEKQVKYKYYQKWINTALHKENYSGIDMFRYSGAHIYILLAALYKLDYLILPQGKLMDQFENAHKKYFEKNELEIGNKATQLEKVFKELEHLSFEKFSKELYKVKHTFPITKLITTQDIAKGIEIEMSQLNWYYENRHFPICKVICDYVIASQFFNHTLPALSHQLMHIYFQLTESDFFNDLGIKVSYDLNDPKKTAELLKKDVKEFLRNNLEDSTIYDPYLQFESASSIDLLISYIRFIQNFHY